MGGARIKAPNKLELLVAKRRLEKAEAEMKAARSAEAATAANQRVAGAAAGGTRVKVEGARVKTEAPPKRAAANVRIRS